MAQRAPGGRLGRGTGPAQGRGGGDAAAAAGGETAGGGEPDPAQGGGGFFQGGRVTKYAFVSAARADPPAAALCRVVGVSVSGFYAWLRAIPTLQSKAAAEAELRGHIGRIFTA